MTHRRLAAIGAALCAVLCAVLLSSCGSGGKPLAASDAEAQGWAWPLTVQSGEVVCDKGISGPEVGFIPDGSKVAYPLSTDAWAAVNGGEKEYPGSLRTIHNGKQLMPLLQAAWKLCDVAALGPLDHDVEVLQKS